MDFDETGLYKGFVKNVEGQKYPGRNPEMMSLTEADEQESYSGVLNDNVVLLDADEQPYSDILLKIIEGEKLGAYVTDRQGGRGIHALMINGAMNSKKADKVMLACGIVVDFHPAYSAHYECLKYQGEERKVIYDESPYQAMPKYFTPIPKCTIDFTNLGEGDGRNSALFGYILTLQNAGLEKEDIRETIRILNKYVLKEPLSDDELKAIVRNEAFKTQVFFIKNKFRHDKFAEYIKSEHHVKKINGELHVYDNGVYVPGWDSVKRVMIHEISSLKDSQLVEVINRLNLIRPEEGQRDNLNLIAFRNGIYDINTNRLGEFNPDIIITNQIPWDYNPAAKSDLVDRVLNQLSCNDKEIRYLLEEVAGACLYRSATIGGGKCAILKGDKHNGKSTYLHMIECMLGKDNFCSVDVKDFKQRFAPIMTFGKLANIGDDISSEYIEDTSLLKKMITGEVIRAEDKGKPAINFTPYATHIFSANDIPRMKDRTGAMLRRMLIVPFNGNFTADTPGYDPEIRYKLGTAECMEYFIQCALNGLYDLLDNKKFTTPVQVKKEVAEYEVENNPVLLFIEDQGKESIINELTDDVFGRYQIFCADNGLQSGSKITFSKQLVRALNLKIVTAHPYINGKRTTKKMFSE